MLHDGARRLHIEEPEDVERVVDIGQVDLAGVLPDLELVLLGHLAHQPRIEVEEAHVAQRYVAVYQLVERRRLVGVIAVAQALHDLRLFARVVNGPHFLAVGEGLPAHVYGDRVGELVLDYFSVHFFDFCHSISLSRTVDDDMAPGQAGWRRKAGRAPRP